MLLFLLTAVPLSFLFLVALMGGGNLPQKVLITPAIRGGIFALPVYGLLSWLQRFVDYEYEPWPLSLFHGAFDVTGPALLIVLGVTVSARWLFEERSTDLYIGLSSFVAGFFSVVGLIEVVYSGHYHSVYDLFLLPSIRVYLMLLLPALATAGRHEFGSLRIVYLFATLIVIVIPVAVSVLFAMRFVAGAIAVNIALLALAVGAVYLLQGLYFRSFA